MIFAESIRIPRTKLRLTQEELAHELVVHFATVNRWENGNYKPSCFEQKAFHDFCNDNSVCIEDYDD